MLAGRGPERHLQRLRQAALAGGEPLPRLFLDPAYARATHFRLCTLQVPPGNPSRTPPGNLPGPSVTPIPPGIHDPLWDLHSPVGHPAVPSNTP